VKANAKRDPSTLILGYVGQQLNDGIDPSTVLNRLSTLTKLGTPLDEYGYTRAHAKLLFGSLKRTLVKHKNHIGTRHRPLMSLSMLSRVYASPPTSQKDADFQLFFYLLVVSGQRAANLVGSSFVCSNEGVNITFTHGRKTDPQGSRGSIWYSFEWTEPPPNHLAHRMRGVFHAPAIGTAASIASNMNAWLKAKGHRKITSAVPRAHLDNVLRVLLEDRLISSEEFERLMDHTVATSDKHYYAL